MAEPKIQVSAQVRVVLEIDVSDAWGGDCPMSQITRQAKVSAENILRTALKNTTGVRLVAYEHVKASCTESTR